MEGATKPVAAFLGLLTAVVVLLGALTDQGWVPSVIKRPVQSVVPGDQPNERAAEPTPPPPGAQATERAPDTTPVAPERPVHAPDTCIQGYVWREAVPDDHVCVTPPTRDQTWEDNRLADTRRIRTGGPYGPDTCLQGYVWREAVPDDHVCVTPPTRDKAREDNRLADTRIQR